MRGIYRAQTRPEPRGWRDGPQPFCDHETAAQHDMQTRARSTRVSVRPHRHRLDGRQRGISVQQVLVSESLAVHRVGVGRLRYPPPLARFRMPILPPRYPTAFIPKCNLEGRTPHPSSSLPQRRLNNLGKRVPCAIQPRLHRAKIAVRNLRDLFVRPTLNLAQHEHFPVMHRQL
jgi:hypothetical protein